MGKFMKLNSPISTKLLAFIILLLLCLLLAFASSCSYGSVAQSGTNQPAAALSRGNDWPRGSVLSPALKQVSLALVAYPNATLTYKQPLNTNNLSSSFRKLTIRPV